MKKSLRRRFAAPGGPFLGPAPALHSGFQEPRRLPGLASGTWAPPASGTGCFSLPQDTTLHFTHTGSSCPSTPTTSRDPLVTDHKGPGTSSPIAVPCHLQTRRFYRHFFPQVNETRLALRQREIAWLPFAHPGRGRAAGLAPEACVQGTCPPGTGSLGGWLLFRHKHLYLLREAGHPPSLPRPRVPGCGQDCARQVPSSCDFLPPRGQKRAEPASPNAGVVPDPHSRWNLFNSIARTGNSGNPI